MALKYVSLLSNESDLAPDLCTKQGHDILKKLLASSRAASHVRINSLWTIGRKIRLHHVPCA